MKHRANVRRVTGATKNYLGAIEDGLLVKKSEMPPTHRLEIEEADGAFFLIRYAIDGEFAGDSWHQTLEEAKQQALHEFEVEPADWSVE